MEDPVESHREHEALVREHISCHLEGQPSDWLCSSILSIHQNAAVAHRLTGAVMTLHRLS